MNKLMLQHFNGNRRVVSLSVYFTPQQSCCRSLRRAMTATATRTPPPGPVLTFLSPSPAYSRAAVKFLNNMFHLPQIGSSSRPKSRSRDRLDELHFGSLPASWDSVACACPTSGTILHFLSFSKNKFHDEPTMPENKKEGANDAHSSLHLIAIHGSDSPPMPANHSSQMFEEQYYDALINCRQRLANTIQKKQIFTLCDGKYRSSMASNLEARLRGLVLYTMCNVMGRQPNPAWILAKDPFIEPLLDLAPFPSNPPTSAKEVGNHKGTNGHDNLQNTNAGKLRELALPFFPEVLSLQAKLSKSSLLRPLPGLYQCSVGLSGKEDTQKKNTTANTGLIFRPLPAAQEDLRLSHPSLVFQCDSLAEVQKLVEGKLGGETFKIGWRGHGQLGSLMVSHPSILGLDIRICEVAGSEWILSSSFDEAQESLLAGSLAELQSTHVVTEGGSGGIKASSIKGDTKNGNGDCWVEFRSTIKHPTGFLKQLTSSLLQKPARTRVAKPPDLPYE
mmetsp:Transcript_11440/g.28191  ORF Transcript_11440/g.28191 Transcript_11440/m.28191 type:complete len:504 (+) Transcript_11440:227-1738(+)